MKVHILVRKAKLKSSNEKAPIVCSSDGESKSNKEHLGNICSKEQCTRNTGDNNYQADKSNMQPVKPAKDLQLNRPAVPIHDDMSKIMPHEDDKNSQVNMKPVCDDKKSKSTNYNESVCSDKKCQETKFLWPVQSNINMQSMQGPAKLQPSYKKKGSSEI